MRPDIDLNLADRLQFRVNHEKRRIEGSDPGIYMLCRGGLEPGIQYVTLHWDGCNIPARIRKRAINVGKTNQGQWVADIHWTVLGLGYQDFAGDEAAQPYQFNSQAERICAASLILKALESSAAGITSPNGKRPTRSFVKSLLFCRTPCGSTSTGASTKAISG